MNETLGLTSSGLPAPLSIVSKKPLEFLLSDNRPLFDPLDGSVTGCLYTSIWKNTYKQNQLCESISGVFILRYFKSKYFNEKDLAGVIGMGVFSPDRADLHTCN